MSTTSRVFSVLLKYWRMRRGLSQLDLALEADVSARHISFLETGRSQPSQEMVLLLASTLNVPLRERNVMLREAGFAPVFEEPTLDALPAGIEHALTVMLKQHEPFPMMVLDPGYTVLRMNQAAERMVAFCLGTVPERWNALHAFFDADGFRPFVHDWETTAQKALARLHREALHAPHDERLVHLRERILNTPGIPQAWRKLDLATGSEGALNLRFQVNGQMLSFVVTMMSFHAPQNVTLDEIQIESYFPSDASTEEACRRFFGA